MPRSVAPEILDTLPATDSAAQASRRDLQRINRIMGNRRWFRRELSRHLRSTDRVIELGAGDGDLCTEAPPVTAWDAIDLAPAPPSWLGSRWHRGDLRAFDRWSDYSVVIGNLIFHHLQPAELAQLGEQIRRQARLVLASEPARTRRARWGFKLLCPILRAHRVTRHDGRISIAAGFRGPELVEALGLEAREWRSRVWHAPFGAYRLIAERRQSAHAPLSPFFNDKKAVAHG